MFWWRIIFTDGKTTSHLDGFLKHFTQDEVDDEVRSIESSIGLEEYARAKGVDLTRWKVQGVFIVTNRDL